MISYYIALKIFILYAIFFSKLKFIPAGEILTAGADFYFM